MKYLLFITVIFFSLHGHAQSKDETAIRKMLAAQVKEWNKGNIDGFMIGYWENDSLQFIGKSGPTDGYNATLQRYKKGYPDAAHMGKLTSTVLDMKQLSPEYYFVTGRWELKRDAGDVSGSYTLLIRKINDEWVIVADHSS